MTNAAQKSDSSRTNQSSEKLLTILEVLSEQSEPIRLQELAELCSLNSSTVLRFIAALQNKQYIAQDIDTGRYYCTFKICALAENVRSSVSICKVALPYMRNIAHIFSESCNLCIEENMQVVYVETVKGPNKMLISTNKIGNIAPMHCTGVGKLFMSGYTPLQLDQFLKVMGLTKLTDKTIVDEDRLKRELALVRERGYAIDDEECEEGVRCVAAPVLDYSGRMIAGISVSGPAIRMSNEHIFSHIESLLHMAEQVSLLMGWQKAEQ